MQRRNFIDQLIPEPLRQDADTLARARIAAGISALLFCVAVLFIVLSLSEPSYAAQIRTLGAGMVVLGGNWLWLHRHHRLDWAARVVVLATFGVVGASAWIGSGVEDQSLTWLGITPLLAVLLVGRRFGAQVAVMGVVLTTVLYQLRDRPGMFLPRTGDAPFFELWSTITFVGAVYLFARLYENARTGALGRLRGALGELQHTSDRAQLLAAQAAAAREAAEAETALKGEFLRRIMGNAKTQGQALSETRAAMSGMNGAVKTVAGSVHELRSTASEAGKTADELVGLAEQTRGQAGAMADAVNETSASIQQMRMTLREVAKNVEGLLQAAEATNTSMVEMEQSISSVERSATQTALLADTVIRDAERGRGAVNATLRGTEGIRDASRVAGESLRSLAGRITDIGAILTVIQDVAERTNLLALNASIIAAQAGESGKGFAVVAREIKDLADQTSGSVKQIGDIVASIHRQSANAVSAIGQSEERVEEGMRLSQDADLALSEIVSSAQQSTTMVRGIAQATVEQGKSIRYVVKEMERVTQTVNSVANTVREQSRASDQIAVSTDKLGDVMPRLQVSADDQARGSERVKESMRRIAAMLDKLDLAQGEQSRESERILNAVGDIAEAQVEQVRSVEKMQGH